MGQMIKKQWVTIILCLMVLSYIGYFSFFTTLRYRTGQASYFDLGIMHQAVYNTYRSVQTGDWGRFLEITNPHGFDQVKRMAIHNDIFLALLAPLYFIYDGPETLVVVQAIIVGLGAFAVFSIAQTVFNQHKHHNIIGLVFAACYLLYPSLQRATNFDFHPVTLVTSFLLFSFAFWLKKKYRWSFLFIVLSLLTKEQVALTLIFFGIFSLFDYRYQIKGFSPFKKKGKDLDRKKYIFSIVVIAVSTGWFLLSMLVIIPLFRGSRHFALDYYDFKQIGYYLSNNGTYNYFTSLLGPLSFTSLFSPLHLFVVIPEFAINIFSSNENMRNTYYHYTSVITPFIFISSIYGVYYLGQFLKNKTKLKPNIIFLLVICSPTLYFSYKDGPLIFAKNPDSYVFKQASLDRSHIEQWVEKLKDERIKIAATGHLGSFFSSRRFFYNFSENYFLADYVIVSIYEAQNGWQNQTMKPAYEKLTKDERYALVFKKEDFEVYQKKQ